MIFNLGAQAPVFDLTVTGYPGATVIITNGKKSFTKVTDSEGTTVFNKLKKGSWKATVSAESETATYEVEVSKDSSNLLNINAIPDFTYTGSCQIVNDNGIVITRAIRNWKIRLLSSGTLTVKKLNGASTGSDVFCVGGGGGGAKGGGGGGFTKTAKGVSLSETNYNITIGAGGSAGANGGSTTAIGVSAAGGNGANTVHGGAGGSGGGSAHMSGGSDGGAGGTWGIAPFYPTGGAGQGTTTREFGESTGTLYAGGGGGGGNNEYSNGSGGSGGGGSGGYADGVSGNGHAGTENTGGGGGGAYSHDGYPYAKGGSGGSGIVIIRNAR